MMGVHHPHHELFSYNVNLSKRVRGDHPLRRIVERVDFTFIRAEVAASYGSKGHVSIDPVVLLKMMFLLFWDDIASERELMNIIPERLDYLWFLGYGLDDVVPNHSVLSKARARWGKEAFEKFFTRTIAQCVQAGLVDNKRLLVDSSLVQANASNDSILQSSPELVAALRRACAAQEAKLDQAPPASEGINATRLSITDPEATLARKGKQSARLSYKSHRTVDDAHSVVTAVKTTSGEAGDAAQLPELLEQHEANVQQKPKAIVGDGHYGSAENYRVCQRQGVAAHLKPVYAPRQKEGRFTPEDFHHDSQRDCLVCPAGKILRRHNFKKTERLIEYRIERPAHCRACQLRAQCTRGRAGRTVVLPLEHQLVRRGKEQALSAAAQASYRIRHHCMEGSFADAANNHGFKRARWRGLWRQQVQDWLIAAIQNLRILMTSAPDGPFAPIFQAIHALIALLARLAATTHSWAFATTKLKNHQLACAILTPPTLAALWATRP
jgi:transposase